MLPLAILNGQPIVGCICADGTFKTDCPAMRETAGQADTGDCCAASRCRRQVAQTQPPSCCQRAADNTECATRAEHRANEPEVAGKGCCQPALEAPVPPRLVSVVQVADDHHLPALATVLAEAFVRLDAVSAARQVEDDTGQSPIDLVITLRHLLI